jgi:hypothetical protein
LLVFESWGQAALEYAAQGWPVVPLHRMVFPPDPRANGHAVCDCGRKPGTDCKPGKHPRTEHGLTDATTDVKVIKGWIKLWPESNLAMLTGAASGIVALDIDPRHDGLASMKELTGSDAPGPAWGNLIQITGGGGFHVLLRHPETVVRNRVGILLNKPHGGGLDIRGDGGYIVVAPSNHESGKFYEWLV